MSIEPFIHNEEEIVQILLDNTGDMLCVLDLSGQKPKVVYMNKTAKEILGYTLEELNAIGIEAIRRPFNESDEFALHLSELQNRGNAVDYVRLLCKEGCEFPAEVKAKIVNHNGKLFNIAVARDITERFNYEVKLEEEIDAKTKELQENLNRLRSFQAILDANTILTTTDKNGIITYANDRFCELSGYTQNEVVGRPHNIVRHKDTPKETFKELWSTIRKGQIWQGQIKNRKKNGDYYIVQTAIVPVMNSSGEIEEYISIRHDMTEIFKKQEKIEELARTDSLTGLANRFSLSEELSKITQGSMALIDINRFHEINNFYGDAIGDKVLKAFAKKLASKMKRGFKLFHLQGDEFIILNTTLPRDLFTVEMIELNRYMSNEVITVDERYFYIQTTIALAFESPELLLSSVNLANTYAKNNKLSFNTYSLETSLEREYKENLEWAMKIKKAILEDRITAFFQPIVCTKTQEIYKYEALVRLIDEDGSVISPFFFLDKAKRSNLYKEITKKVIDKAFNMSMKNEINCGINISMEDIANPTIRHYIFEKLDSLEHPERINFEIVESEGIQNLEEINEFIQTIKSFGCLIAIDDFGTGYSNFAYLLQLNADIIKIDGSLIKEIAHDQDTYDILKTIVSFAKIKNLKTVAEFVSSPQIHQKVLELGIDYSQGYLFGAPQAIE